MELLRRSTGCAGYSTETPAAPCAPRAASVPAARLASRSRPAPAISAFHTTRHASNGWKQWPFASLPSARLFRITQYRSAAPPPSPRHGPPDPDLAISCQPDHVSPETTPLRLLRQEPARSWFGSECSRSEKSAASGQDHCVFQRIADSHTKAEAPSLPTSE